LPELSCGALGKGLFGLVTGFDLDPADAFAALGGMAGTMDGCAFSQAAIDAGNPGDNVGTTSQADVTNQGLARWQKHAALDF
jgi:hypothetical protein